MIPLILDLIIFDDMVYASSTLHYNIPLHTSRIATYVHIPYYRIRRNIGESNIWRNSATYVSADLILANTTCIHTQEYYWWLAILFKNRQSPKFTPRQYFILYGI